MSDQTHTGTATALVNPIGVILTDAVLGGSKWGTGPAGTAATVTFSFPEALSAFDTTPDVPGNYNTEDPLQYYFSDYLDGFSPFDAAAQSAERTVLARWASVANIRFNEVPADSTSAGTLRFAFTAPPAVDENLLGVSWLPQDIAGAGDTWVNSAALYPEGWAAGSQNMLTLLHETGHALGLKHPFDQGFYGSVADWPATTTALDTLGETTLRTYSTRDTVMAYNDAPGVGMSVLVDFAPTTPMRVDIAAMQTLYGPNLSYNAGDTVYTFDGESPYHQTLWDGGGRDTIRATGSRPVLIDLTPGSWSELGLPLTFHERKDDLSLGAAQADLTTAKTVYIYDTVQIENAIGGGGKDRLVGNAAANVLQGGGGNDDIDGVGGTDIAAYSGARAGYLVELSEGAWVVTDRQGSDGKDSLHNVERLQFSDIDLALDTRPNEPAGQVAGIIRGLFGAPFVKIKTVVGIGLNLIDKGMSYNDLVAMAISTPEFAAVAGSRSNSDFVRSVYTHVVGQAPSAGELANYTALLDNGAYTQASLGVLACKSTINTQSVDLVGLAYVGLEYVPPPV